MTTAILELNDQNLLIQTVDGVIYSQPGFALVTASGIEIGEKARALAWRKPQDSYNDYWRQLNQTPLPTNYTYARHHADMAYSQLKQLLSLAESPESLIIAVPGSFSDEQISLLLGLVNALGVKVEAVLDTALAACAGEKEPTILVELQLHQAMICLIDYRDDCQIVSHQEIIPNIGTLQIYNSVAHYISETLIKDYRYDPLHTSEGSQVIYDHIPEWLIRFKWEDSITITLPSPQGDLTLQLHKAQINELLGQRLSHLKKVIKNHAKFKLIFSQNAILIPTLITEYSKVETLSLSCTLENCAKLNLRSDQSDLYRITNLKNVSISKRKSKANLNVTHILFNGYAYPISQPLGITLAGEELLITSTCDNESDFELVVEDQKLQILKNKESLNIRLPNQCKPGELIDIAGNKLILIEVKNG